MKRVGGYCLIVVINQEELEVLSLAVPKRDRVLLFSSVSRSVGVCCVCVCVLESGVFFSLQRDNGEGDMGTRRRGTETAPCGGKERERGVHGSWVMGMECRADERPWGIGAGCGRKQRLLLVRQEAAGERGDTSIMRHASRGRYEHGRNCCHTQTHGAWVVCWSKSRYNEGG